MTRKKRPAATAGRQGKRSAPQASGAIPVEGANLNIDQAKLDRSAYTGSPRAALNWRDRASAVEAEAGHLGSPAATGRSRRIRGDIQALNAAIFEQADAGSVEPLELNADVEILIGTLSERLTEDSSKMYLREFADLARDPLREDTEPTETENRFE